MLNLVRPVKKSTLYIQNPCLTRSELSLSKIIEMINVQCEMIFFPEVLPGLNSPDGHGEKYIAQVGNSCHFGDIFQPVSPKKNQRIEIHLGHGHKREPKCFLYLWSSSGNLLYIFASTATIQRI